MPPLGFCGFRVLPGLVALRGGCVVAVVGVCTGGGSMCGGSVAITGAASGAGGATGEGVGVGGPVSAVVVAVAGAGGTAVLVEGGPVHFFFLLHPAHCSSLLRPCPLHVLPTLAWLVGPVLAGVWSPFRGSVHFRLPLQPSHHSSLGCPLPLHVLRALAGG